MPNDSREPRRVPVSNASKPNPSTTKRTPSNDRHHQPSIAPVASRRTNSKPRTQASSQERASDKKPLKPRTQTVSQERGSERRNTMRPRRDAPDPKDRLQNEAQLRKTTSPQRQRDTSRSTNIRRPATKDPKQSSSPMKTNNSRLNRLPGGAPKVSRKFTSKEQSSQRQTTTREANSTVSDGSSLTNKDDRRKTAVLSQHQRAKEVTAVKSSPKASSLKVQEAETAEVDHSPAAQNSLTPVTVQKKDPPSDESDIEEVLEVLEPTANAASISAPSAHNGTGHMPHTKTQSHIVHNDAKSAGAIQNAELHQDDDEEYNYDDEEFEDYESDFEDYVSDEDEKAEDEEAEEEEDSGRDTETPEMRQHSLVELEQTATNTLVRKEALLSKPESPAVPQKSIMKRVPTSQSFINFSSAQEQQKREHATNKIQMRGAELLELITLDRVAFDVFDMPPVPYDVFIRTFGRANTKQAHVQTCNMEDVDVQTEVIDSFTKWTQHPAYDHYCVGGEGIQSLGKSHMDASVMDAVAFSEFVQKAGQVMLALLDEEWSEENQSHLSKPESDIGFSDGYFELSKSELLKGYVTTKLQFSKSQASVLLSVHEISSETFLGPELQDRGLLCIWNVTNPREPTHILCAPSVVTCCAFGPNSDSVVLAGMFDGSIGIWDLQEPSHLHGEVSVRETKFSVRRPAFCTAYVLKEEGHHSSVVSISPVIYSAERIECVEEAKNGPSSTDFFHVVSLEDLGVFHIWVVVEVSNPDIAGSDTDLGLAPGGKIKLIRSTTINLANTLSIVPDVRTFDFQVSPLEPSHMFVTTDVGVVIHCTHFGGKATPQMYVCTTDVVLEVRAIDFSPHRLPIFLAGCSDGGVRMYSVRSEYPKLEWQDATIGESVVQVQWSRSRPTVFFVLDASARLHVWDLSKSESTPVLRTTFPNSRPVCFSLSIAGDGAEDHHLDPSYIVFAMDDGALCVYPLNRNFTSTTQEEYDELWQHMSQY